MRTLLNRRRVMLAALDKSPYSKAATTTLKTDFPDYWEDIKAYGYANPQMVSWINEDPHLVCSLLDVGKVRWLVGDGASWVSGIYDSNDGFVSKIRFRLSGSTSNMEQFFGKAPEVPGASDRYSRNGLILQKLNNNYHFNFQAGDYFSTLTNFNIQLNTIYNIEVCTKNSYYLKVDDTAILTGTTSRGNASSLDMPLFANANQSNRRAIDKVQISQLELYAGSNNDLLVTLVPFVSSTRNGVLDIHDLSNPTFYANAGTGTFTTTESYYPYGQILSSTKTSIIEDYGEDTWYELKEYLKDFNKANLVPYINEDYHIVSSLVTSGKTRANKSNDGAYIEITVLFRTFWKYEIKYKNTGGWLFGAEAGSAGNGYGLSSNTWRCGNKYVTFESVADNTFHSITATNTGATIDGKTYSFDSAASDTTHQNVITLHGVTTGSSAQKQGTCARFRIKSDSDVLVADVIPYVDSTDSNRVKYLNIGSSPYAVLVPQTGYFTIEETDTPLASITSQTRATIIDSFGYEVWRKVRDYFNDESKASLVQYVNEDPYIIISLGLVSGVERWLLGDDNACVNTQYILNSNSKVYVKFKYPLNKTGIALGSRIAYQNNQFIVIQKGSGGNYYIGYGNETFDTATSDNNIHEVEFNKNIAKFDNISHTFTAQTFNTPGNAIIMGNNTNNTISICGIYISKVILDEKEFHPFIRNNVNGMIDILSNTFYPNANSVGAFTIEYSGLPFLNISSTTKNSIITAYGQDAWTVVKNFFTDPATESLVASVNSDYTVVEELCDINGGGA